MCFSPMPITMLIATIEDNKVESKVEEIDEDECEFCGGEGFVVTDEDDGEGHVRIGVGHRRCVCKQTNDEDQDD